MGKAARLDSVDLLRGIIMVVMALDHVRDFFTNVDFDPLDFNRTNPLLFLTRWITHYCAPNFIFLAGTGAFLGATRGKSKPELCRFLWTRGLWLILLDMTVIRFSWAFNWDFTFNFMMILWPIGFAMIVLAGLVSIPAAWLAACAARGRLSERLDLAVRITAWTTAAYVGWIAVYVIVLHMPITPGHAESLPWRHWLVTEIRDDRPNVPILSLTGGRDLLFTGWVVGAPLLFVAASLWRQYREEVRIALCYAVPSVLFVIFFWPIQGLGEEMDLVVAAFPALYALAWVCAHSSRRTTIAAALLVSAHVAFWRILFDERFVNQTL